jgi:hypothetical protein
VEFAFALSELDQFDGRAADVQTDYTFFRAGEEHGVFKLP